MQPDAVLAALQQELPAVEFRPAAGVDDHPTIYVRPADLPAAMGVLRRRPDLQFDLLAELTACDYWPREPRFEVIYILVSTGQQRRVRLKVAIPGVDPHVPTVCDIWPAANWLEREVWDLFGVAFDGHPDPRRLLMPEDWEGYPLRKDYPVQINKRVSTSAPMQVTEEEFRANVMKDRLTRE